MTKQLPNNCHVVLIDNQDSFTYNLVDELKVLGVTLCVYRNTVSSKQVLDKLAQFERLGPTLLMLSPGPGAPSSAGNLLETLQLAKGKFPILGICLGHQAIVQSYGGKIARAPQLMHGKASQMSHSFAPVFQNLPSPMTIARYHSLAASEVPDSLRTIAQVDATPMAVVNESDKVLGFQFHPESILTLQGSRLLLQAMQYLMFSQEQQGKQNAR